MARARIDSDFATSALKENTNKGTTSLCQPMGEALLAGDELTVAAYDPMGRWIDGNMDHIHPLYKLLPCLCVILARECRQDSDFNSLFLHFTEEPVADIYPSVVACTDLKRLTGQLLGIISRNLQ